MKRFLFLLGLLALVGFLIFRYGVVKRGVSATYLHYLGNQALSHGQVSQALHYYKQSFDGYPDRPLLLTEMADLMVREGDNTTASHDYQQALENDPHYLPALLRFGHLEWQQGHQSHALALYKEALVSHPTDAKLVNELTDPYLSMAQSDHNPKTYQDAIKTLNRIGSQANVYGESRQYQLAADLYAQKDYKGALARYCQLASIHPTSPETLYSLAITLYQLGDNAQAAAMMVRATQRAEIYAPPYAPEWATLAMQFSNEANRQAAYHQKYHLAPTENPAVHTCLTQYLQGEKQAHLEEDQKKASYK